MFFFIFLLGAVGTLLLLSPDTITNLSLSMLILPFVPENLAKRLYKLLLKVPLIRKLVKVKEKILPKHIIERAIIAYFSTYAIGAILLIIAVVLGFNLKTINPAKLFGRIWSKIS